ncbi:MAG: LysR family transcriptional regulator [Aestuariivita sp.]|nr:LysR family transcriptional regulator [Aestuariivita sp.]
MKLDPNHLAILAAIVDHGGLSEGAHALGKSQPSVSRSLAMLEERLGTNLFLPNRRPLQPTELCLALAQEGRKVSLAVSSAAIKIQQSDRGLGGVVRVAGTPIFMDGVVSSILAAFQSGAPDIHIRQSYDYTPGILNGLHDGTLDVGFAPIRKTEIPDKVEGSKILTGCNVIACRTGHPLSRKSSVRLSDIAEFTWVAPPPDSPLYHDLRAALDGIGVRELKVSFSGGSLSAVINVLVGSDSLTVLPYSVVFMLRKQNVLSTLHVRIGDPDRHLFLLSPVDASVNSPSRRLIRFITSEFHSLDQMIQRHRKNAVWY